MNKLNPIITERIVSEINSHDVVLFMKGTPDAPQCGFSMAVSNILKILEVNFKGINVLEDQSLREGIKVFSDWPTIPQLYINEKFIGERGRINCSLRDPRGFWRWLGVQFIVGN